LYPDYGIFIFIAGKRNDSAFVMPLEDLTEAIPFLSPQKDFLVYVDGHGKTFGQAMDRGFEIASRFNINMVVFDWPSDYLALRKTVYNTDEVSVNFLKAMRNLDGFHQRYYRSSAVSVLFHSMGNRIIKSVSHPKLLGKMPKQLFSNIIINAAAVKMQNHTKWVERLNIQQRIYITMNDRDMTLKGAALLRMARQLGNGKPDRMAENASYINFGKFPTAEHNLFLGKSKPEINIPQIFLFYQLVFHGREIKLTENVSF